MKIILKIWLLGALVATAFAQANYDSQHLVQDTLYDSEEAPYHPSSSRRQYRSHEPVPYEEAPENDHRHYQSLEERHHQPEPETYYRPQSHYHSSPQHVQYHQPEDPSYHRPQEIVHHQPRRSHQPVVPRHEEAYQGSTHYPQPEEKEDPKYEAEEPKYVQAPRRSHPAPVPTDPKLPLYFTMYEKRIIQDPMDKYGKGPWRYLTYGHGITYGSKEPGKVFEKGYGYIRALGRDHCKQAEHLCPPRDDKPFDYEGRKEPYFGYRPH